MFDLKPFFSNEIQDADLAEAVRSIYEGAKQTTGALGVRCDLLPITFPESENGYGIRLTESSVTFQHSNLGLISKVDAYWLSRNDPRSSKALSVWMSDWMKQLQERG